MSEKEHAVTEELAKTEEAGPVQIQLFEPVGYGIAERIRGLNIDQLRPIEALQLLSELAEGAETAMRIAGVMSGTVARRHRRGNCRRDRPPHPHRRLSFDAVFPATRAAVLAVSDTTTLTSAISRLNFRLAELYAAAVRRAVRRFRTGRLIGCHGQTVYHEGGRNTLQLGEPAVLAERTGLPVVSNFRARDIAAGGQGAPLVPYVDYLLFRHATRTRVALNIGGIANITVIPAGAAPRDLVAFDTGPGNMVIDALAREWASPTTVAERSPRRET